MAPYLKVAEDFIVKDVQSSVDSELGKASGKREKGSHFTELKWHTATRNLRPGDVVIIVDRTLGGEYRLASERCISRPRWPSAASDSSIQKLLHWRERVHEYLGAKDVVLVLLIPADCDPQKAEKELKDEVEGCK